MECQLSEQFFLMNTDARNIEDIKIPQLQHVRRCLLLHLLRIVFAFVALDHTPCARMIWIPTTILILLLCKNSSHRFQQRIGALAVSEQRVLPFYRP